MRVVAVPLFIGLMLLGADARSRDEEPPPPLEDLPPPELPEPEQEPVEEPAEPPPEPEPEPEPAQVQDLELEPPAGPVEPEEGWLSFGHVASTAITSFWFPLGLGHAMIGEWLNWGWFFTATQVVGGFMIGLPFFPFWEGDELVMVSIGASIAGISYIWEKIDFFVRAHRRLEPRRNPDEDIDTNRAEFCRADERANCMTRAGYNTAGWLGSVVGFGLGHFISGEAGWGAFFLLSEAGATGGFALTLILGDLITMTTIGPISALALFALRFWEKYDVWKRPRHKRMVVNTGHVYSSVRVVPVIAPLVGEGGFGGAVVGLGGTF